jgi:hypothetical protein
MDSKVNLLYKRRKYYVNENMRGKAMAEIERILAEEGNP